MSGGGTTAGSPAVSTSGSRTRLLRDLVATVALACNAADDLAEAAPVVAAAVGETLGWPAGVVWRVVDADAPTLVPTVVADDAPRTLRNALAEAASAPVAPGAVVEALVRVGGDAVRFMRTSTSVVDATLVGHGLGVGLACLVAVDGEPCLVVDFALARPESVDHQVLAMMETVCRQLQRVAERDRRGDREPRPHRPGPVADRPPRAWEQHVRTLLAVAPTGTVVAAVDIDRLVDVNRHLGPSTGETVLAEVTRRLQSFAGAAPRVVRGGDDFLVALPSDATDEACLVELGWRLLTAFDAPVVASEDLVVGVSVGLASSHQLERPDPSSLRHAARRALEVARSRGARRVVVHRPDGEAAPARADRLRVELGPAITARQFVVHFQPVVRLHDQQPVGAEALVRWRHPARGLLAPCHFIPEAERSGLIRPLGMVVLEAAARAAAGWPRGADGHRPWLAVNISPAQLDDPQFTDQVLARLRTAGLDPSRLVVEVTETSLAADVGRSLSRLARLQREGIRIAVDDFGAGYSGLGRLNDLPFDQLKLDRGLVVGAETSSGGRRVMKAAVDLGRDLGMDVVAEGLESPTQRDLARIVGCAFGQGYVFSHPVAEDELATVMGTAGPAGS